ncbi:hypothetical protein FGB62_31g116 [Gracilaria domingensis]|nr:hypothetical protein FGB62_31g116 [Gracilaria domingensis]
MAASSYRLQAAFGMPPYPAGVTLSSSSTTSMPVSTAIAEEKDEESASEAEKTPSLEDPQVETNDAISEGYLRLSLFQ